MTSVRWERTLKGQVWRSTLARFVHGFGVFRASRCSKWFRVLGLSRASRYHLAENDYNRNCYINSKRIPVCKKKIVTGLMNQKTLGPIKKLVVTDFSLLISLAFHLCWNSLTFSFFSRLSLSSHMCLSLITHVSLSSHMCLSLFTTLFFSLLFLSSLSPFSSQ